MLEIEVVGFDSQRVNMVIKWKGYGKTMGVMKGVREYKTRFESKCEGYSNMLLCM